MSPKSILAIALSALTISAASIASAASEFKSGIYTESEWVSNDPVWKKALVNAMSSPGFANAYNGLDPYPIKISGSNVTLSDKKLKIDYSLNIGDQGEQELPQAYLDRARSNFNNGALAKVIRRIYFTNVRQISPGEIRGNVNFEIGYRSTFGSINTTITIGTKATAKSCVVSGWKRLPNGSTEPTTFFKPCIEASIGDSVALTGLSSDISSLNQNINAFGAIADLTLKLMSAAFSRTTTLYSF